MMWSKVLCSVLLLGWCMAWPGIARAQPAAASAEDEYELDVDLIRKIASETVLDQVDLPPAEEWQQFWKALVSALHADSLDDLAALSPWAQKAFSYLQAMPSAQPVRSWLRQRQDYFDMARQAALLFPAPPPERPVEKPVGPSPRARLVPPRPARVSLPVQLTQKRLAYLRSQESWTRKLRGRMKPDEAAFLVPQMKNVFEAEGVAPEWVWIAEVESGLNPQAVSPVGAAGLFQFMPTTAQQYGLQLKPKDERLVPEKSARAAARCLRSLYAQFGSWPLALAAYNAGAGRVGRALKPGEPRTFERLADQLPLETQMYVPKVLATVALREAVDPATLPAPKAALADVLADDPTGTLAAGRTGSAAP